MNAERYLRRLRSALRRVGYDRGRVAELTAEVRSYLEESGDDPLDAFGEPEEYALERTGVHAGEHRPSALARLAAVWLWWSALGLAASAIWSDRPAMVVAAQALVAVLAGGVGVVLWRRNRRRGAGPLRQVVAWATGPQRGVLIAGMCVIAGSVGYTLVPFGTADAECDHAWADVSEGAGPCRDAAEDRVRTAVVVGALGTLCCAGAFVVLSPPARPHGVGSEP